jgi:hypothetical protein
VEDKDQKYLLSSPQAEEFTARADASSALRERAIHLGAPVVPELEKKGDFQKR